MTTDSIIIAKDVIDMFESGVSDMEIKNRLLYYSHFTKTQARAIFKHFGRKMPE